MCPVGAHVGEQVASALVNVFVTPFSTAALILLYFDIRVRKEGFDLELLAQSMEGGAPPPQPYATPVPPVVPDDLGAPLPPPVGQETEESAEPEPAIDDVPGPLPDDTDDGQ